MILKSDAKFEEKPICCFKNDKNFVNFDPSTQIFKIFTVICPFCAKDITFDQKKYGGVIFNDTEESSRVKIGTFMGSFCPKQKMHELKIYRRVMCNYTEELRKSEE